MEQRAEQRAAVLTCLLEPVGQCLTPEVAKAIVNLCAAPQAQARIDELADKCTEGMLSPEEQAAYETFVHAIDFIAVLQAQAHDILEQTAHLDRRGAMPFRATMGWKPL